MPRLAILCPGQGAQHAHMFDLACQDERARRELEQWKLDQYLGMPLQQMLDSPALLFRNRHAQVLIVAAAMAAWASLRELLPRPDIVLGYSIGEISSYGVSGALSAQEALSLADTRARLMDDAKGAGQPQGMLSITGLTLDSIASLLERHRLSVAIVVADTSIIAGGPTAGMAAVAPAIRQLGGETAVIPVEIASHTPLMRAALQPFCRALESSAFHDPLVPVMAGVSAELVVEKKRAREQLLRQLTDTIRWSDCMDACVERGVDVALELGPGAALSRMLQKRYPDMVCRSVQDFRSLAGLADWIDRHCR